MTAQLDLTYLTEVREAISIAPTDGQRMEDEKSEKCNETAFDQLVLESGHKDMIISLITQHFQDKKVEGVQMEQVDIVRGKGTFFSLVPLFFSPFPLISWISF